MQTRSKEMLKACILTYFIGRGQAAVRTPLAQALHMAASFSQQSRFVLAPVLLEVNMPKPDLALTQLARSWLSQREIDEGTKIPSSIWRRYVYLTNV